MHLDRMASDDAIAVVLRTQLVQVEFGDVILPVLDCRRLLAVEPQLVEGRGHGLEKIRYRLGILLRIDICWVIGEVHCRHHHVAVNIATATVSVRADIGNRGDDRLQVRLHHTM